MPTRLLDLTFDLPIDAQQLPQFRGALIERAGREYSLLHNHLRSADTYHYRYPLIQYRINRGNAALFAIDDGADVLGEVLGLREWEIKLGNKPCKLRIADLKLREHTPEYTEQQQRYTIRRWVALNQQNYKEWIQIDNLTQRTQRLEKLLASHIISFANAIKWQIPQKFDAKILRIAEPRSKWYHQTQLMTFDADFEVPLLLPYGIGLGKAVSQGLGVIDRLRNRNDSGGTVSN